MDVKTKETLLFVVMCAAVFAAMLLVARLFEKYFCKEFKRTTNTRYVAYIGMFSALGGVLMMLEFPLFFAPPFYKIDLSELPVLMSTFYLGPVAGVLTEFLKIVVKLLIKGSSTAYVGDFGNFVVGCALILPASIIYHRHKTRKTAIAGMVTGTLIMTVFGSAFNAFYLIPKFAVLFGMPIDAIVGMGTAVNAGIKSVNTLVLFAVVPFNLLKGAIVSLLTYLLYKRVEHVIFPETRRPKTTQLQSDKS